MSELTQSRPHAGARSSPPLLSCRSCTTIAFGVILFSQPGTGALAVVWMIGWFAVVAGCLYIALALRLKKLT
jgi:uncharacterized membrane protein HdeD (DUF308 family)